MEGYRKAVTRMTLDMSLPDVQKSFSCTKGDVNRRLEITLVDGGNPFAIPNNWTVFLTGTKPDETELYNGCVVERGKIIYDFASGVEIATCTGTFGIQFDIFDKNGEPIAGPKVWVHVLEATRNVASNDQFTALGDLIGKINEVKDDVSDLDLYVRDLESSTRNVISNIIGDINNLEGNVSDLENSLSSLRSYVSDFNLTIQNVISNIIRDIDNLENMVAKGGPLASTVGQITIPANSWTMGYPSETQISLPDIGENMVALLVPADDITRAAATNSALAVQLKTLDTETNMDSVFIVSRAEGAPTVDMTFVCFAMRGNSEDESLKYEPTVAFVGIATGTGGGGNIDYDRVEQQIYETLKKVNRIGVEVFDRTLYLTYDETYNTVDVSDGVLTLM